MSLSPLLLLLLLNQKRGGGAPSWPEPPGPIPKMPQPAPHPSTPTPSPTAATPPSAAEKGATASVKKRPPLRPLPSGFRPYPSPIPQPIINIAKALLGSLAYGDWVEEEDPTRAGHPVIFRKEMHTATKVGVTAYRRA